MNNEGRDFDQFQVSGITRERELLQNRRKKTIWLRLIIGSVVAVVLALLYLNGSHGYLAMLDLQRQNREAQERIAVLEKENEELKNKLDQGGKYTDEQYIRIARETLGWVLPGEKVYRFVKPKKSQDSGDKP